MRLLLQFPEGLKQKGLELAKKYESEGHQVFLSASPCYGACDICLDEGRWLKADKIIHFGHNKFVKNDLGIPVEYVPYRFDIDISKLAGALSALGGVKSIGLGTTVQHSHQFEEMKKFFETNGKEVHAATGEWAHEPGQVLGCDSLAISRVDRKIEAIVFIGNGNFHPLAIETEKPVFIFNPLDSSMKRFDEEIKLLRRKRQGAIVKALSCKRFGVLLSTKPGQFNIAQAEWARKEINGLGEGYECAVLVANELEPIALNNFLSFECFINTACPRMVDDSEEFGKPVLSISMLKEMLKIRGNVEEIRNK